MILKLNTEDLQKPFSDNKGCPIFTALKRQGYKVEDVRAWNVIIDGKNYELFGGDYFNILKMKQGKEHNPVEIIDLNQLKNPAEKEQSKKENKMYRQGQQVKVDNEGSNASQFNTGKISNTLGVYQFRDWSTKVFEIEGTVKLCTYKHDPKIQCAYLLSFDGKKVGYVYDHAIKEVAQSHEDIKELIQRYGKQKLGELIEVL